MPLRAIINGVDIIAPLVTDGEWEQIRTISRSRKGGMMLPCCNSRGHARVSKLGTRHFYHKPRATCENREREGVYHLKAKTDILLACRDSGYNASTEVSEKDWRADVLAWQGKRRLAFEVQWSYQTIDITRERQKRYQNDNVRGCWFARKMPARYHTPTPELPIFSLYLGEEGVLYIALNGRSYPLMDFTSALLTRRIKFCPEMLPKTRQRVQVAIEAQKCWRCGTVSNYYRVRGEYYSVCGCMIPVFPDELTFRPELVAAARRFLATDAGRKFHFGSIKKRYNRTRDHSDMSFGCRQCDALFGERFISTKAGDPHAPVVELEITMPAHTIFEGKHWCFSEDGRFCV